MEGAMEDLQDTFIVHTIEEIQVYASPSLEMCLCAIRQYFSPDYGRWCAFGVLVLLLHLVIFGGKNMSFSQILQKIWIQMDMSQVYSSLTGYQDLNVDFSRRFEGLA